MRIIAAAAMAAIIALLAMPVYAEEDPSKAEANKAEEQKKKEAAEIEKAYKETIRRTRGDEAAKKKNDPWGNLR